MEGRARYRNYASTAHFATSPFVGKYDCITHMPTIFVHTCQICRCTDHEPILVFHFCLDVVRKQRGVWHAQSTAGRGRQIRHGDQGACFCFWREIVGEKRRIDSTAPLSVCLLSLSLSLVLCK